MGTCFSKKKPSSSAPLNPHSSVLNSFSVALSSTAQSSTVVVPVLDPVTNPKKQQQAVGEPVTAAVPAKKEVFLIKHRKSHDDNNNRDRNAKPPSSSSDQDDHHSSDCQHSGPAPVAQIRTSSCTKEELDAILIQCGRLSRSSSGKAASSSATAGGGGSARRYSGSKRSFDFDSAAAAGEEESKSETPGDDEKRVRERRRHSPSPQGRRRTPSRERERDQQRSSSRERRISRSPGRRCTDPSPSDPVPANNSSAVRPGKMVSVPATVSNNNNGGESAVKRISVKRNVGGGEAARSAASPRAQSPARAKNECQQQQQGPSLSRSSSRKAEISPFRRNPLSEIDPNSLAYPNRSQSRGKRESEGADDTQAQKLNPGTTTTTTSNHKSKQQQQQATVETTVVISGDTKPQAVTRTRSSRRSRDLDFNPESLTTATPSYTRLLLEDIHNFHQKVTVTTPTPSPATMAVNLPACLSKACSILEAVADLNNNTTTTPGSNLSTCAFSEDQYSKTYNNLGGPKDPFVESEVGGCDDLMEPSFHKYVTVRTRRGSGTSGDAAEDQESSGSNSYVGGGSGSQLSNRGLSPSSWEPNSADSTDWSSRDDDRLCGGRKRESYGSGGRGIGRGRLGPVKGLYPETPVVAATADSTL